MAYTLTTENALTNIVRKHCKIDTNKFLVACVNTDTHEATFKIKEFSSGSINNTDLTGTLSSVYTIHGMVALSSTKFAIIYNNNQYYSILNLVILTLSGTTLTIGTPKLVHSVGSQRIIDQGSICALSDSKVAIISSAYSEPPSVICCTVSGTTITPGTADSLYSRDSNSTTDSIFKLDTDKFGIVTYNDTYRLYSYAYTVSGTTLTKGSRADIKNSTYLTEFRAKQLDTDKFIVVCGGNGISLTGFVCTVSSTTITVGSESSAIATGNSKDLGLAILSTTSLVVSSNGYWYSSAQRSAIIPCTISGTTLTPGTGQVINNTPSRYDTDAISDSNISLVRDGYFMAAYPTTVAPTVTTQDCTSVGSTGATGNGNITATGGADCTRRGFCYMAGTSGDPTTANSVAYDDGTFSTGAFTKAITGLSASTGYRVRAYAVNSAGTSYGTTVQLTTSATAGGMIMMFE